MKRILFVDDEPEVLAGLRNLLRRHRRRWDMQFAQGGREALARLRAEPFNVVVSDMRMPEMDGATLLAAVKDHHPDAARIILSGYSDQVLALRATQVAHQCLSKPCDADTLENVLQRALDLQELVGDERVRRIVGGIETLPTLPEIYTELSQALTRKETTVREVTAILEQDMAVCAKLLQMVNSAFFRLARKVTRIEEAVAYLGMETVRNLALAAKVFDAGPALPAAGGLTMTALQEHSLQVASLSKAIAPRESADAAFTAGLLHDVGLLILAVEMPEQLHAALVQARREGRPFHQVERELYGTTHAEIGAYLLGLWGLPHPVVEAVGNHHEPQRVPQCGFDLLAAVHTAECLAHEAGATDFNDGNLLDPAYLAGLEAADRLETWRKQACSQAKAMEER